MEKRPPGSFEQKQLSKKKLFNGIAYRSKAYEDDLSLLNELKSRIRNDIKVSADQNESAKYKDQIQKFYNFIKKNKSPLTDKEKSEFLALTRSNLGLSVKRRLFEDFAYKIKKRINIDRYKNSKMLEIEKEILDFKHQPLFILRWLRITLFALKYHSLTLLSHHLRGNMLTLIKEKAYTWQQILEKHLKKILDRDYEKFTNQEYNFLMLIVKLREPLEVIRRIEYQDTYAPREIGMAMDDFTKLYLKFAENKILGQHALQKAFRGTTLPRNIAGVLRDFQENPHYQIVTLREQFTNTITGALYAHYTSREGKLINNFSQLIYVTSANVNIDHQVKQLTNSAKSNEGIRLAQLKHEERNILNQFDEVKNIIEVYPAQGKKIITTIFLKKKIAFPEKRDFQLNKSYYVKYMLDYFFEYFGYALLYSESQLPVVYMDKIYKSLFENWRETYEKIEELYQTYQLLAKVDWQLKNRRRNIKIEILELLSNLIYTIGRMFTDIIKHSQDPLIHKNKLLKSYSFFENAYLTGPTAEKLSSCFGLERISLLQYMEYTLSVCYYIAELLEHPSFDIFRKESTKLKEIYDKIALKIDTKLNPGNYSDEEISRIRKDNEGLRKQIEELQYDELTELPNRHYLNNRIIPYYYQDKTYTADTLRYVFFCDIDKFKLFNDNYGHAMGDQVLKTVAQILREHVCASNLDKGNTVIRIGGEEIMGYINNISRKDALQLLYSANSAIQKIELTCNVQKVSPITLSIGLYTEWEGSNQSKNMHMADLLMYYVKEHGRNNIAYLKDEGKIITGSDLDELGNIKAELIKLYHPLIENSADTP